MRDSLSLFDQAIAHAGGAGAATAGPVRAEDVRQMLGLADRTRVIDLFEALMRADIAAALKELRDQYDSGADPAMVLGDLAEFTHFVTRVKIVPALADDISLTEAERTRGRAFAAKLSMRVLARTWQMLLKGIGEVEAAGRPVDAAEMVLVRIAYAADLPTPDEVIRSLGETRRATVPAADWRSAAGNADVGRTAAFGVKPRADARGARVRAAPLASAAPMRDPLRRRSEHRQPMPPTSGAVKSFEDLIALAAEKRDLAIKSALERDVRLVRFEDGRLELALEGERAQDADRRTFEEAHRLDRPPLDGRRFGRSRRAVDPRSSGNAQGRAQGRRARRSPGAGGAGALSRRRNRRGAPAGRTGG